MKNLGTVGDAESGRQIVMGLNTETIKYKQVFEHFYMPDTMLGALCTFFHLILIITIWDRHDDSHFQLQGNWHSEMLNKNAIAK